MQSGHAHSIPLRSFKFRHSSSRKLHNRWEARLRGAGRGGTVERAGEDGKVLLHAARTRLFLEISAFR